MLYKRFQRFIQEWKKRYKPHDISLKIKFLRQVKLIKRKDLKNGILVTRLKLNKAAPG